MSVFGYDQLYCSSTVSEPRHEPQEPVHSQCWSHAHMNGEGYVRHHMSARVSGKKSLAI